MLDWKRFEDEVPTEATSVALGWDCVDPDNNERSWVLGFLDVCVGKDGTVCWMANNDELSVYPREDSWRQFALEFEWTHWAYVDAPAQGKTLTHAFTGFFYADRPCIEDGGSAAFVSFDNCEVNPFKGMTDGKVRVEMVITSLEESKEP